MPYHSRIKDIDGSTIQRFRVCLGAVRVRSGINTKFGFFFNALNKKIRLNWGGIDRIKWRIVGGGRGETPSGLAAVVTLPRVSGPALAPPHRFNVSNPSAHRHDNRCNNPPPGDVALSRLRATPRHPPHSANSPLRNSQGLPFWAPPPPPPPPPPPAALRVG
ncbi:hypothetical protein AAG570_011630 [Ranatra chinensis]|uniref:Uncharacterized protein n=1 Tax=Ranatra chinensis TaxID=642074 RepID=A0ABD0YL83_9HEMI